MLRTQRKLTAIFALAGSVTLLLGILSYNSVSRLRLDAEWVAHTHGVVSELRAIDAAFVVAEATGAITAQVETREHLRVVRELTVDNPEQQERIRRQRRREGQGVHADSLSSRLRRGGHKAVRLAVRRFPGIGSLSWKAEVAAVTAGPF